MTELAEADALIEYLGGFITENKRDKIANALDYRTRHFTIVLENIYQPHNASACLRSCECLGVQDVHVVENEHTYRPNQGVSMGSGKWLSLHHYSKEAGTGDTQACLQGLKDRDYQIVATSPHLDGHDLTTLPIDRPIAIVYGTEEDGLSDTALAMADHTLRLPMFGLTESYNISVCVAIAMSRLIERLHESDLDWHLSEDEKRVLTLSFYRRILKRHQEYERRYWEDQRA